MDVVKETIEVHVLTLIFFFSLRLCWCALNGVEVKRIYFGILFVHIAILGTAAQSVDILRSMKLLEHFVDVMKNLNIMWGVVFGVGSCSNMCALCEWKSTFQHFVAKILPKFVFLVQS